MKPFIVIDNFYEDPDSVRDLALSADFVSDGQLSSNFPGKESVHNFYTEDLVRKFESILNQPIAIDTSKNAFGRFRMAQADLKRKTQVHFDDTAWSAVIYLSKVELPESGTGFFRHKKTGLSGPPKEQTLRDLGYRSLSEFDQQVVLKDTLNKDAWELTHSVEMKFNRCILLRGNDFFHGSLRLFGSDSSNSRLTQNFFFNTKIGD